MKLTIKDSKGKDEGEMEVKFPLIEDGKGTQAVHDAVVAYQAAQRMGTACTKNVGEVAGTNKKPWRQKGTGRARAGSFASPLWRGGGVVFGPKPRDFTKKISRSTRQLAFRKALSERLKAGDVEIVDDLKLREAKTKEFLKVLSALELTGSVLIVTSQMGEDLLRASRNVQSVEIVHFNALNTYQLLRCRKLLFTREAFEKVEEKFREEAAA